MVFVLSKRPLKIKYVLTGNRGTKLFLVDRLALAFSKLPKNAHKMSEKGKERKRK